MKPREKSISMGRTKCFSMKKKISTKKNWIWLQVEYTWHNMKRVGGKSIARLLWFGVVYKAWMCTPELTFFSKKMNFPSIYITLFSWEDPGISSSDKRSDTHTHTHTHTHAQTNVCQDKSTEVTYKKRHNVTTMLYVCVHRLRMCILYLCVFIDCVGVAVRLCSLQLHEWRNFLFLFPILIR